MTPKALFAFVWSRKWLVIVPAIVSSAVAYGVSRSMPVRYQSEARVRLVPQQILASEFPVSSRSFETRLAEITQGTLSRTRLESIITKFNLYARLRQTTSMEDVVERMRRDVAIEIVRNDPASKDTLGFRVSFASEETPETVKDVTDRLTSMMIEENLRDRTVLEEGTNQFLQAQIEDKRKKLLEYEKAFAADRAAGRSVTSRVPTLEYEALQAFYKTLLTQSQEHQLAANLERRQIGEQFRLLDVAAVAKAPLGPGRATINMIGAIAGLALGIVLLVVAAGRARRTARVASFA